MRLNIGCGRDVRDDWVNLDHPALAAKVDGIVPCDIDQPDVKLPFEDDTFDALEALHVLEHLTNLLPFMQEAHRVTKPGGLFYIEVPFGSSDDAFEDPTHVRQFYPGSWAYFSAPTYWRSDYGYGGDWKPQAVLLILDELKYPFADQQEQQVLADIIEKRNIVHAMKAVLECVKPARQWDDAGGLDRWETRVVFGDMSENDPQKARQARIDSGR